MDRTETAEHTPAHSDRPAAAGFSLDGFPRLEALVRGPDGAALLDELSRLVQREPRAQRFQRDLFARVRAEPASLPEVAVVRDISLSGVRLELAASAHLDISRTRSVAIEMRLPRMPFVTKEATLVRVVEHTKHGVELAFAFVGEPRPDPAFEALLERLSADR